MIPVVAGILVALFIDNWNENRKDESYINQVFSTIDNELSDTKNEIIALLPQQNALIDSLEHYSKNRKVTILDVVMRSKGINYPQIKTNAWKSVANGKIDLVDYKKVTSLSDIEEHKETLTKKTDFLMNFLYTNIDKTDASTKQTLKIILLDIIQTEKTIERSIEQFEKSHSGG